MAIQRHLKKSKNGKYNSVQGIFYPKNPDKITNTNKKPRFKSKLEMSAFIFMDKSKNITSWSYEPYAIWYRDMTKFGADHKRGKKRRYYIDIVCDILKSDGTTTKALIEVKHSREVAKPKPSSRKSERNKRLDECTYQVNQCKWSAARAYCKKMGYQFIILTEKELK